MSKESDKSTPVPTPHDKNFRKNQSTSVDRSKPKINIVTIIVLVLIVLAIIAAFAGLFEF